jgi:large exoprotein involved in heme utilization and adhesion
VQRSLSLRRGSYISTRSGELGGSGNGGNIKIAAPIILGLENSDIVANAFQGKGGTIQITTQGIIGLQYRDRLTSENDITASSELGFNGTVEINNVGVDPNSGLIELSETLIDHQKVAAGCDSSQGSKFVITGRGGVPEDPRDRVSLAHSWSDLRDVLTLPEAADVNPQPTPPPALVEATAWQRNSATGEVELIAASPMRSNAAATCAIPFAQ